MLSHGDVLIYIAKRLVVVEWLSSKQVIKALSRQFVVQSVVGVPCWAIKMGVVLIKWVWPKNICALVMQSHHSKIPRSAPAQPMHI